MSIIDRRNILELIGRQRGKYHSCILTCFNFDFSFFEERVLPVLRTANIKNINVFADGNFLEEAQEMTTGKEFNYNRSYNFLPIYEKGVFHPKIMFLTGLKHGLLIIGSGNITSSGLSANDEIWGAFHLDNTANENAALFYEVWKYLKDYTSGNYGFLPQKIEWIKKYSPWLETLQQEKSAIELTSINQTIQFLSNNKSQSIYQQLLENAPSKNLKSVTIISPYYDKTGTLLKQLLTDFQPPVLNCMVDTNSGILPSGLGEDEKKKINFYDWQNCRTDYTPGINRLHAKIFHFEYYDEIEKMLLGSANATMAAMGGKTTPAANAEAGVLISRRKSGNWLNELKIILPDNTIEVTDYQHTSGLDSTSQKKSQLPIRILYSEIKGTEINCYLNKINDEHISLVVLSRNGAIIETAPLIFSESAATAKIISTDLVFKIYIINSNGERLSNYSIVHQLEMLLRCNPDPTQEKFDDLLEKNFSDGEGITDLLDFVHYNWADEDSENTSESKKSNSDILLNRKNEIEEKTYQTLNAEEFNKVDENIIRKQVGLLSSSNVKLADFLNLILLGNTAKESDFNESEEQKLFEDAEQKGEGSDVQNKEKPRINAIKEKRALHSFFAKLDAMYTNKLSKFYQARALTMTPTEKVTLTSISKILIGLQLVHIYHGKKFNTISGKEDDYIIKQEKYLLEGAISDRPDSVKGFLLNVIGKFLLLATAGYQNYDYSILNEKMLHYKNQVFEKALLIMLSLNWKSEEEFKYRMTLLLNLHYYILPNNGKDWFPISEKRIDNIIMTGNFASSHLIENLNHYRLQFLPGYQNWLKKFSSTEKHNLIKEISEINQGEVIFNSKIGFNHISQIANRNPYILSLKRPGYELKENGFILQNIAYGAKYVQFRYPRTSE